MDRTRNTHSRKRLVMALLIISFMLLVVLLLFAWWLVAQRGVLVNRIILEGIVVFVVLTLLMMALGLLALIWSLWRAKSYPFLQRVMTQATRFLFPLAIHLGKWLGLDEERIKNSYIQVSNQLVRARLKAKPLKNIFILAPHCLQRTECPHKITIDVGNCRRCGKCPIDSLLGLAERYQVTLEVVTGGTSARKIIRDYRPEGVVAIACERDLTSGIQDIMHLPIMGVVNERPEGPCRNTCVDLKKVEEALVYLQKGG